MPPEPVPSKSKRAWPPSDKRHHAVAQALCYLKHNDWRYDPGNPKHNKFLAQAACLIRALEVSE